MTRPSTTTTRLLQKDQLFQQQSSYVSEPNRMSLPTIGRQGSESESIIQDSEQDPQSKASDATHAGIAELPSATPVQQLPGYTKTLFENIESTAILNKLDSYGFHFNSESKGMLKFCRLCCGEHFQVEKSIVINENGSIRVSVFGKELSDEHFVYKKCSSITASSFCNS